MDNKKFEELMNKYVESKSGDVNTDLQKLSSRPLPEKESSESYDKIQKKASFPKYAVALIAAMCVVVLAFAIVFPIAYINTLKPDEDPEKGITKVWTASTAYEVAVQGGYTGTYEEFLQVFSQIETVRMDEEGNLTLKFSDGTEISAGKVEGNFNKGIASISVGENGDLIISYSDGSMQTLPSSLFKGEQGVGIADMYINDEGYMIVILTDGSIINAGLVNAKEKYTLTIDADGGYIDVNGNGQIEIVDESPKEYESGTKVSLPKLSKKMYTFEGWYMVIDGREISVGDSVTMVSDITVVAKWSGGPNYPDYEIPQTYHGLYVDQNNPSVAMEVFSDVMVVTMDGGSDNYYPTIIDGKVKIYMNNYYIDILLDVSFGENAMIISYDGTTTLFVKVT